TTALLFTSDLDQTGLVARLQDRQREIGGVAAQWAAQLAEAELEKVTKGHEELERVGHGLEDGPALLEKGGGGLKAAGAARHPGEHGDGYEHAQVAMRSVRVLMRAHWENAIRPIRNQPNASPYAVSFYTLPAHWRFLDELRAHEPGENLLADGNFEQPPAR